MKEGTKSDEYYLEANAIANRHPVIRQEDLDNPKLLRRTLAEMSNSIQGLATDIRMLAKEYNPLVASPKVVVTPSVGETTSVVPAQVQNLTVTKDWLARATASWDHLVDNYTHYEVESSTQWPTPLEDWVHEGFVYGDNKFFDTNSSNTRIRRYRVRGIYHTTPGPWSLVATTP